MSNNDLVIEFSTAEANLLGDILSGTFQSLENGGATAETLALFGDLLDALDNKIPIEFGENYTNDNEVE